MKNVFTILFAETKDYSVKIIAGSMVEAEHKFHRGDYNLSDVVPGKYCDKDIYKIKDNGPAGQ